MSEERVYDLVKVEQLKDFLIFLKGMDSSAPRDRLIERVEYHVKWIEEIKLEGLIG